MHCILEIAFKKITLFKDVAEQSCLSPTDQRMQSSITEKLYWTNVLQLGVHGG